MTVDLERLQGYNQTLLREVAALKAQVLLLKRTIRDALAYWPTELPPTLDLSLPEGEQRSWADRVEHFDDVREKAVSVVIALSHKLGEPVPTVEVVRGFRARYLTLYSKMSNPGETIPRRLREAVEQGVLTRPSEGHWFLGPRLLVQENGMKTGRVRDLQGIR